MTALLIFTLSFIASYLAHRMIALWEDSGELLRRGF